MIKILSIQPHYNIDSKEQKEITAYTVTFQVKKKTASSGDLLALDGSLTLCTEKIDFDALNIRIINNLQNLFK